MPQVATVSHAHLVTSSFVIPLVATLVMELAETLVDKSPFDWRERFIKTGWDLCVLAVGSSGAIFTLPEVQRMLGPTYAIDLTVLTLLGTVFLGLCIAAIRKRAQAGISGWHGIVAMFLGGTALGIPWYIVVKT